MKITNHAIGSPSITPQQLAQEVSSATDAAAGGVVKPTNSYTPSAELQRLLGLVRAEPDVRADRVAEIALRVQQGNYLNAGADEKVADGILADRI